MQPLTEKFETLRWLFKNSSLAFQKLFASFLKSLRWLFENSSLAFLSYRRLLKFLANIFQNAAEDFLNYWLILKKIVVKIKEISS